MIVYNLLKEVLVFFIKQAKKARYINEPRETYMRKSKIEINLHDCMNSVFHLTENINFELKLLTKFNLKKNVFLMLEY